MGINQSITLETAKGDCYRFLSACFYQPQNGIFIDEGLLKNLSASLRQICPEAAVFASEMEDKIISCSDEELAVEYARLFVGPFELVAPPFGSVYLDGEKRVMGDSTMEVIKMYQEEGLVRDGDFKNLPDHIAVELEFMYYLTFKGMKAREQADDKASSEVIEKQNIFLNRFLRSWVPQLCDRIKEGTDNGFYKALAGCLNAFIKDNKN